MDRPAPYQGRTGDPAMALKPLTPPVTQAFGNSWELLASEGGRSNQGLRATITLFNGMPQACQTVPLGDPAAQQALAAAFAGIVGVDASAVTQALMQLAVAVEGVLRQMEAQQED